MQGAGWWEIGPRGRECGRRRHLIGYLPLRVSVVPDWLVGGGGAGRANRGLVGGKVTPGGGYVAGGGTWLVACPFW